MPNEGTALKIKINPGDVAPRYERDIRELKIDSVVITEQGMESGLPLIDFQLTDAETGKPYFVMVSGRLITSLSAAIQGVNLRNHGKIDP